MPIINTLTRHPGAPLISKEDIPDFSPDIVDASSVFNPGAVRVDGQTHLLLRVQTRGRRTFIVPAMASDGLSFKISDRPTQFNGLPDMCVFHNYDARLTLIENQLYVITALDTDQGCRCALWRANNTPDADFAGLNQLDFVSLINNQDTRNAVLFPERINGLYHLLHRPNQTTLHDGPLTGSSIRLSVSEDLITWQDAGEVMSGNPHYWDELIGSGPPPIKTRHGWLHLYHGVATHFQSSNIYQAGAVLLDLDNPTKVLARTRDNILEPRESWEQMGQVPNVVFPSGATVSHEDDEGFAPDDAILRIYYGAADTVVGLAQGTVGGLVKACQH